MCCINSNPFSMPIDMGKADAFDTFGIDIGDADTFKEWLGSDKIEVLLVMMYLNLVKMVNAYQDGDSRAKKWADNSALVLAKVAPDLTNDRMLEYIREQLSDKEIIECITNVDLQSFKALANTLTGISNDCERAFELVTYNAASIGILQSTNDGGVESFGLKQGYGVKFYGSWT